MKPAEIREMSVADLRDRIELIEDGNIVIEISKVLVHTADELLLSVAFGNQILRDIFADLYIGIVHNALSAAFTNNFDPSPRRRLHAESDPKKYSRYHKNVQSKKKKHCNGKNRRPQSNHSDPPSDEKNRTPAQRSFVFSRVID